MARNWNFGKKINLRKDENLQRIVQFYVWETPVSGVSSKGTSFSELGWKGGSFNTLHARMKKASQFPSKNWIAVSSKKIEERLREINRLAKYDCSFEFAIHAIKDGLNKTEGLFYFIRNAFAHGGFATSSFKGEKYYVLENRQGSKLKGRAVIRETTLLNWIKIVEKGPRERL